MSKNEQKLIISIKNNTDKEFNDISIFNANSEKEYNGELEFYYPTLEAHPFLDFLSTLKEPKKVDFLRYQYHCEDSNNNEKQFDSKFSIWIDKKTTDYRFMDFFSRHQQQKNILDIFGEAINLKLSDDMDIILERIMPKTSVAISFIFKD
jgi:hypothetical protein